jgi:hypothetical protein
MPALYTASFAPILSAILERLQTVLQFPPERVLPDARDEDDRDFKLQADQYVLVKVGIAKPLPPWAGAGRNALTLQRQLTVVLCTRFAADEATSDRQWLLDKTNGHIAAEELIYNALAGFQPLDADANWLVLEPLDPQPATPPRRSKRRLAAGWGASAVGFGVTYALTIDATYQ